MKTKRTLSGLLAVLLCMAMVIGMMPLIPTVSAAEFDPSGHCEGHDVNHGNGWKAFAESGENFASANLYLDTNKTTGQIKIYSGEKHLCLNGNTLTLTGELAMQANCHLTICDCKGGGKIILDPSITTSTFPLISVPGTAVLDLYGGEISGNNCSKNGAGVYLNSNGVFNMHNGLITGNTSNLAGYTGGGVFVNGGAVFTMNGGKISNNTSAGGWAHGGGGGISCNNGTVIINDGIIENNSAVRGGAIALENGATLQINGGTISGNTASTNGGAIYVGNQVAAAINVTIKDATISGNTATTSGGVVYINNGLANVTINSGCQITGNAATNGNGGLVYSIAGATTAVNGGNITGNTAAKGDGGAIYTLGKFVMTKGTISGNSAANCGGIKVETADGSFTVSGGNISGNTGGANVPNVRLNKNSTGTISGNAVINNIDALNGAAITIKELTAGASITARATTGITAADDTVRQTGNVYTFNNLADAIVARMVLGNNLDIQFAIPADLVAAGVKINGETATAVGTVTDNGDYNGYSIYEAFVKSNDMTKPFVIEVQKNGKTYTKTESVQAYAERLLGNTNNAEVKTLLVDMLNYGAEAQKYFDKVNTGLANANLTAAQQAAFENVTATNTAGNARLLLENNLDIQIDVGEAYKGKTLKYTFVPFDGAEALTYNATVEEENGVYFITADQVVFADYASVITVMDGNKVVATDSVQNYVGRRIAKGESDVALAKALLKFAVSANEYLA